MILCGLIPLIALLDPGHYAFSGPLSSFMMEGATVGASPTGLPFTVSITENGSKVGSTDFDLKGPNWDQPVHVHFTGASFADGHLKGKIQFKNESGKVLEGLRLDLVGATDNYADGGQSKTRSEPAVLASPIVFADLQNGDDADGQDVDISGLSFTPTTKQVDVTLKLSGLAYLGSFKVGSDNFNPGQLSTDSQGRIYVVDHNTGLWRVQPDGTQPQLAGKWGETTDYAFVDPKSGELIGHEMNSHRIIVNSPSGEEKGKIPASEDFGRWPQAARKSGTGDLYVAEEDHLCIYHGGTKVKDVDTIDGVSLSNDSKFDIDSQGAVFMVSGGAIYRVNPDLASLKKIAFGPDWHLGRVTNITSLRVDPVGELYVLEGAAAEFAEYPRVSVLDREGHFIRSFGRASKAPKDPDNWDGSLGKDLYDITFGADGRVYISTDRGFGAVLMFMPF